MHDQLEAPSSVGGCSTVTVQGVVCAQLFVGVWQCSEVGVQLLVRGSVQSNFSPSCVFSCEHLNHLAISLIFKFVSCFILWQYKVVWTTLLTIFTTLTLWFYRFVHT